MLDARPDDGSRYELIDGKLLVTPSPGEAHQDVVRTLIAVLVEYFEDAEIGAVMHSPSDVRTGDNSRNRIQPDVYVVRRTNGIRPSYPYQLSDLLLAVEVASPNNPLLDYQIKRDMYLRSGVPEYWIVNPEARNISRWSGSDEPGELLSHELRWQPSGMLSPLVIALPEFFARAFK